MHLERIVKLSENRFINTHECTLVKYTISEEYTMCRDYQIVDKETIQNDSGLTNMFTRNYSYGLLTNIYSSSVFIIDIDRIPSRLFYDFKHNDSTINEFVSLYNRTNDGSLSKLKVIISMYKKILGDKIIGVDVYSSSSSGKHVYFVLNAEYDISGLYSSDLTKLICCNGYLKFVINSGYSNIRVTNKVLKDTPRSVSNIKLLNKYGSEL